MFHARTVFRVVAFALVVLLAPACSKPAAPAPIAPAPTSAEPDVAPVGDVDAQAAQARAANAECVGPAATTPEETLVIAGKTYLRKGSTITLQGADADDEFLLGQITDIKDHTPDNAANLRLILAWMKDKKVDAIAVTGDIGESQQSIQQVLTDVAALGVPVLAIAGNRECRDHFTKAVAAVAATSKNVINMHAVRVFNTDDASVVSLPGYYNTSYLHCADGCAYLPRDVDALEGFAAQATATRVLISHGPPLQSGDKAIDRIHEAANVGDPALARFMKAHAALFPFGLFGNIEEAGGYATDLAGTTRVAADTFVDSFYLNPGPADSVRWVMLDKTDSVGMAGIVKIKGKQASYSIRRLTPGEAKPAEKPADKPAPAPGK